MTNSRNSNETFNLSTVALELFKFRCLQPGISPQQIALECFRYAKAFIVAMEQVLSNGLPTTDEDSSPLNGAFAPNLKKTHPVNLMSRTWGDIKQVEAVMSHLDADPTTEFYEPYGWGKPEINQARALFPAVINRIKHSIVET